MGDVNTFKENKSKKKHQRACEKLVVEHRVVEEIVPVEKNNKSNKKKHKDCDKNNASQVDNEGNVFIATDADKGNKEEVNSIESGSIERKKFKKKRNDSSMIRQEEKMKDAELVENAPSEKKKSKKKHKDGSSSAEQDNYVDDERNARSDDGVEHDEKGKKRKADSIKSLVVDDENAGSDKEVAHANKGKKNKKRKSKVAENADNAPKKSKKKVRFSGKDEVFILPSNSNKGSGKEDNLVQGKRFTKEEDEILKQAVFHFIAKQDLGEEGLNMVLNSRKHKELKGCWKEIGYQIPYRPYTACYYRAQVLFRRSESRKWTQEEYDLLLKLHAEKGNNWKYIAEELGKHRWHVKDAWRRIHMPDTKKGHWSQQEYQKLFDLVNKDLQDKIFEEKHSKHGMLKDNIPWTSISAEVSTRNHGSCCTKWYDQLTSRLVSEGVWADVDDYVLISELYTLDASCIEDVDWDNILENRPGDLCRKRWNQMVLHIGHHGNKSFSEQVETLAQRYIPKVLEAREAWDNKPRVP